MMTLGDWFNPGATGMIRSAGRYRQPTLVERIFSSAGVFEGTEMMWWWDKSVGPNFGDWIGPYIFNLRTGKPPRFKFADSRLSKTSSSFFLTCGSIMHFPKTRNAAIVWGSGVHYTDYPIQEPRKILAVRGPLTYRHLQSLGIDCPQVFGDPGLLAKSIFPDIARLDRSHRYIVIPHWRDYQKYFKVSFRGRSEVIDPTRDVEHVFRQIGMAELVISSSLHGIIVAHAFGVPAVWVCFNKTKAHERNRFKYLDYFMSVGVDGAAPVYVSPNETDNIYRACRDAALLPDRNVIDAICADLLRVCPF